MNTKRKERAKRLRNADGQIVCSCGCERRPPRGRIYWYSNECVNGWRERNDPNYVRQKLFERDKGICALCGCDSVVEYQRWRDGMNEANRLAYWLVKRGNPKGEVFSRESRAEIRRITDRWKPAGAWTSGRKTSWDADHIVPVIEGGGQCDLSNYRTLCHPCHKAVTAELAARRAAARKPVVGAEQLNLDGML